MPSTITTFETAIAGQRATASQFNTNFSNYRGTFLPINTDTASSSNNTHDIGLPNHTWRNLYANTLALGNTSTSFASMTTNSVGGITTTFPTTTAQWDVGFGAGTITTFTDTGMRRDGLQSQVYTATSAVNFTTSTFSVFVTITNAILSITSFGGNIELGLDVGSGGSVSYLRQDMKVTGTAAFTVSFTRNGSSVYETRYGDFEVGLALFDVYAPTTMFRAILRDLTAGAHTFQVRIRQDLFSLTPSTLDLTNVRLYMRELG